MNEEQNTNVSQPAGQSISPVWAEVTDEFLSQKPLLVPWTWGDYYAVRYLAGTMRG